MPGAVSTPDPQAIVDAESLLGVSISRQQTRLVSLSDSADKVLAFDSEINQDDLDDNDANQSRAASSGRVAAAIDHVFPGEQPEESLGSASTRQIRSMPRLEDDGPVPRPAYLRQRSKSGPDTSLVTIQRAIRLLPKKLSVSLPFSTSDRSRELNEAPVRPSIQHLTSHQSRLRSTASDESLAVKRTISYASSLGDDARFANIQAQVNSRFKAIKDTMQDANIKLPSLRTDILRDISLPSIKSTSSLKDLSASLQRPHAGEDNVQEVIDGKQSSHPNLDRALSQLTGDVVVLGGYRGSILRSAKPPHKQLWVPIKVGLNIRKVDLEVGIADEDDHKPSEDIIPDGMLTHIGPVDISKRLLKKLKACQNAQNGTLRVHNYGYDWRLDPGFLSAQLCQYLESLQCRQDGNGATVIAHSLGGLITRHAVNTKPELFKAVVYAGVPTRCVNILGPLRNGDDVLLSSRVLTAQVNFTIRTSFALLPLDGRCFLDKKTGESYIVDFFDPRTWLEYRLSPCIARAFRPVKAGVKDATFSVSTVSKALPSLSLNPRNFNLSRSKEDAMKATAAGGVAEPDTMSSSQHVEPSNHYTTENIEPTSSTQVSLSFEQAYTYLTRMLANVKRFKEGLAYRSELASKYPRAAVIYGKNTPTVAGAKVDGRDGIKRADAYDDLAFASGDGVVLARASMLPKGYPVVKGGVISTERGHVSLLADLEAVGKALNAVHAAKS